jgi:hypothetical protein
VTADPGKAAAEGLLVFGESALSIISIEVLHKHALALGEEGHIPDLDIDSRGRASFAQGLKPGNGRPQGVLEAVRGDDR